MDKGRVCVTSGTGFFGSWMVMKLLEHGYTVNTTIRPNSTSGSKKDISYLTELPEASERLHIFHADLDEPQSFNAAIEGCIGVFHTAHPLDWQDEESEEIKLKRTVEGLLGILQSCIDSKTVRRVVYTSSISAVIQTEEKSDEMDENSWSDVEYIRRSKFYGGSYMVTKTVTEKTAFEFAEKHGLDLVSIVPSWIHGPFITPFCPSSVTVLMALFFGKKELYSLLERISFVHTDDLVSAHIFLFEKPEAKGRYICSAVDITIDKLSIFLSTRYPEYQIPILDYGVQRDESKILVCGVTSKKLLDSGFKFKYGLEEIYDDAIECCKQRGVL